MCARQHWDWAPAKSARKTKGALVDKDESHGIRFSGRHGDLAAVERLRRSHDGELVWFRQDGQACVIRRALGEGKAVRADALASR